MHPRSFSPSLSNLLLFTLVLLLVLLSLSSGVSRADMRSSTAARINRRGFKSSLLSTARGFGKRAQQAASSSRAAMSQQHQQHGGPYFDTRYDIPNRLVEKEASRNPGLLAALVGLLDFNRDGTISPIEAMRLQQDAND